ncbi:ScaI family restriction endonuclease [Kamptonema sp. UHCC 0994]|uniref:ScaI family restriction endonuclease n=1 Tax=Kamptonema sp. UHCC 0994 TaxID=3031329 RepID=UPI0023B94BF3|nr:ScaI family restriction endonuclease [Kamptonema sp. UHCC 0994]MDF0554094.1 ScaI family restriction endonuclease [Kamptonema sp. UHCC 0994]
MQSPYTGLPVQAWEGKTRELIDQSGYYLVVNFQKFNTQTQGVQALSINLVRFGWIDREDWQGQAAATGQQARLSRDVERYKLLPLPL